MTSTNKVFCIGDPSEKLKYIVSVSCYIDVGLPVKISLSFCQKITSSLSLFYK